jgi:hypothetical protein
MEQNLQQSITVRIVFLLEMLAALPRMTIVSFSFFYFSLYLDEYEQMLWSLRRWRRVVFFLREIGATGGFATGLTSM